MPKTPEELRGTVYLFQLDKPNVIQAVAEKVRFLEWSVDQEQHTWLREPSPRPRKCNYYEIVTTWSVGTKVQLEETRGIFVPTGQNTTKVANAVRYRWGRRWQLWTKQVRPQDDTEPDYVGILEW